MVRFKRNVKIEEQWDLLGTMTRMVKRGDLTFPPQVPKELAYGEFPDAPGAWIAQARRFVFHPGPRDETVALVLQYAEELVDPEGEDREAADPYVAAMAYELQERYPDAEVIVATTDSRDRLPGHISLVTACTRLEIATWDEHQLLEWVREQHAQLA